jgi:hypothetical protein
MPDDPAKPGTPLDCSTVPVTVRQGGDLDLTAPGARMEDITVQGVAGDPVTAAPFEKPDGTVVVRVHAPHGTLSGDFGSGGRVFTITTKIGDNDPFTRNVHVLVSYITAAPTTSGDPSNPVGDNNNPGVFDSPFASFQQAARVAGPGDTIQLRNYGDKVPGPGHDPSPLDKPLPSGITITTVTTVKKGTTVSNDLPVSMAMELPLGGDAFLDNLDLTTSRLVISVPGSHVTLRQVTVEQGITVSKDAQGATLDLLDGIDGGTSVTSKVDAKLPLLPQIPLLVQADGAAVSISGGTSGILMSDFAANLEAVRFEGQRQSFQILRSAHVQNNVAGALAIHIIGSTNLNVDNGTRFISPITIEGSGSTATFNNVNFGSAPLTFEGDWLTMSGFCNLSDTPITFSGNLLSIYDAQIDGQGIEQSSGDAVIGTTAFQDAQYHFAARSLTIKAGTTFKNSPLRFQGQTLSINDATFDGQGIEQDKEESMASLQNVTLTRYTQFGYHLMMGKVDIEGGSFTHDQSVSPSKDGMSPPWALLVEAASDTDSSVQSHGTLWDGKVPPQDVCMCVGPPQWPSELWVTDDVPVTVCP